MGFPTMWYVRPAKPSDQPAHTHSLIRAFASMSDKLQTEHNLEFLSLKGGFTGSSESAHVKMPHCLKSHAMAQNFVFCVPERGGQQTVSPW